MFIKVLSKKDARKLGWNISPPTKENFANGYKDLGMDNGHIDISVNTTKELLNIIAKIELLLL